MINHSERVETIWLRLDFVGIVFLTLGDFVSGIYLVFWCEPLQRKIYWSMVRIRRHHPREDLEFTANADLDIDLWYHYYIHSAEPQVPRAQVAHLPHRDIRRNRSVWLCTAWPWHTDVWVYTNVETIWDAILPG